MREQAMQTLMGSASAEYLTPGSILDLVEKVAPIALDPCAHPRSESALRAKTTVWLRGPASDRHYVGDGLEASWLALLGEDIGIVFVNPPYGRALKEWAAKMAREQCPIIALVPARVDTAWWRELAPVAWCALAGRVKFLSCQHEWEPGLISSLKCTLCGASSDIDAKGKPLDTSECPVAQPTETDPAPFPSAICLLHADVEMKDRFVTVFREHGPVYIQA